MIFDLSKNYWAIYKPDADTEDGILLFESRVRDDGKLWFVMVKDNEFRYEASLIGQDDGWVIWQRGSADGRP
jgi:hypothetical protein